MLRNTNEFIQTLKKNTLTELDLLAINTFIDKNRDIPAIFDGTDEDNTAVILAFSNSNNKIGMTLLSIPGIKLDSLLIWSINRKHIDIIWHLLKNNLVNVNAVDMTGTSALILAAKQSYHAAVIALLAKEKIQVNAAGQNGKTALIYAVQYAKDDFTVLRLLKDRRVDVSAKDIKGRTALHWAVRRRKASIIPHLVAHNIDVNAINIDGDTALIYAVTYRIVDYVKILLTAANDSIDINIPNKAGKSALSIVTDNSFLDKVLEDSDDKEREEKITSYLLEHYAKWLLKAKKEDITPEILVLLKPHKTVLYHKLIAMSDKLTIMKRIINEKEKNDDPLAMVFWFKNASLDKGRLGAIFNEYLQLTKGKEKEKDKTTVDLFSTIVTAHAYSNYTTIINLLLTNKSVKLITPILDLLKPIKKLLFEKVTELKEPALSQAVKEIFEGRHTTALGQVFWYKNSALHKGKLSEFYNTYKLLIETRLAKMKDKDLTPADIQFVSEFVNSEAAYKLEDPALVNILTIWLNKITRAQLSTQGVVYFEQYQEPTLPPLAPTLFQWFQGAKTSAQNLLFNQNQSKETAALYKSKL